MTTPTAARTAHQATAEPVADLHGVTKSYGDVQAVTDLTLTLRPGETVALLGPNGAGKSTTLDMLLGLRPPTTGTARLFGLPPHCAIRAGRVGAMLQSGGLMPDVTVRELIGLACDLHPRGFPPDEVLAVTDIASIAERRVQKLSGGQEQRVRFALAVAGDCDLLVLDEPTTGMDVNVRQAFWESMRAQAQLGKTVLFATHYLEEADSIADRVLVLHRGRLIADGTAAEIKARAGARRVSFTLSEAPPEERLRALPGVRELTVSQEGTVRIATSDADATVAAVYRAGLYPRGLEVTSLNLEQAFIAITHAEDAR